MGALPFSMSGEKALADEIHRAWRALLGMRCKCIALDLDFTLWGGVIGEDGSEGIILDDRYLDFQRRLRELKDQGVLLAVLSKNNMEDALTGLRHSDMLLREDDFVSIKANWRPKSENLRELALELNLGLDSFVFVDDNPIERGEVSTALPEVRIPELPQLPEEYPAFAAWLSREYFPLLRLSDSDAKRTADYQAETKRKETFAKFDNLDSYLASLDLRLKFRAANAGDVARVAQLTQKTNQFNLTTRRYTEGDIRRMLTSPEWRVWLAEVEDKFGAYGVTCLCMVCLANAGAFVDTFLMSCRVMGRGIESVFLSCVEKEIAEAGFLLMEGLFIPTRKNMPVVNFWKSNGYELVANSETDERKYRKYAPFSTVPSQYVTIEKI